MAAQTAQTTAKTAQTATKTTKTENDTVAAATFLRQLIRPADPAKRMIYDEVLEKLHQPLPPDMFVGSLKFLRALSVPGGRSSQYDRSTGAPRANGVVLRRPEKRGGL